MIFLGRLDLMLSLRYQVQGLGALFFGTTTWQENGIVYCCQVAHQWNLFEVYVESKCILNILRKIHGIVPTYVIAYYCACLDIMVVLFFVVGSQILRVIHVHFFILRDDSSNKHPDFGSVAIEEAQHFFAPALLQRSLVEVMSNSKQSVLMNRCK